ncbi:MAG TPA: c-type cytochrome [Blastocatellia bacterium]|nr:c-type cytochrome [Blastocatellia bacterium]HMV83755.1 c-type cytochrome [Blastocatellia bacterium]HMX28008.1 c-type cytochrome [Blastocatellia bacterium]HMY71609.1 c-type cytochrome [Blastocatellia bacterium]HMZ21089.1 c-type cytochrome [Blastocatellia bacterium]
MRIGKLLLVVAFVCAGLLLAFPAAAQKQNNEQIARGRKLFANYCASCHGVEATGNGPVAPSLKKHPSDLTRIESKNGKFPAEEIRKKIAGDGEVPVHGKKDMPVWGLIFSAADINNLVKYLESIQKPFQAQPAS